MTCCMRFFLGTFLSLFLWPSITYGQQRPRALGIEIGVLPTGMHNAITDVPGVLVGHTTLSEGENIRTGVTAIVPHGGNLFTDKVPAALFVGNGFGKLMGISQIEELGSLETPILLTNTLNVPRVADALITYMLRQNPGIRSVNPVVGETNDGYLNDIRGRHVSESHVFAALEGAASGPVAEGNVGAGTGTLCHGFKGGIGTSSRVIPKSLGGYTVGVLVQTNFGAGLIVDGVPVGQLLGKFYLKDQLEAAKGSCMIVIATNAPVTARNLKRMCKRSMLGLSRTGGIATNGSGDYAIAFSTAQSVRHGLGKRGTLLERKELRNRDMSPLFLAVVEATEEAIINSLFAAKTMVGRNGHKAEALPLQQTLELLKRHGRLP